MDCYLHGLVSWCFIVFYSVCAFVESSRLVHSSESRATNSFSQGGTYGRIQPQFGAVKQKPSTELRERPRPVTVNCHPDAMEVVVQADMFDTGLQVDGGHLRLGSDSAGEECGAVPSGEAEFTIRAQLVDCGTKLSSTKEKLIYDNVLVFSPEPSTDGLLRLDGAAIPVECHYNKKYSVGGVSLHPTWVPLVATASAEDQIDFHLLLMTDDWTFQRGSYTYFLGDSIHFEVSAVIGNHMPLRVYVDHCVGTATPDADVALRYDFVEHGCLTDAYLTNSSSCFLPRTEEHTLRFQLDAFIFYQAPSNQVYITCHVKAVPATMTATSQNRACSLTENRWHSVDGNDEACRSCNIAHHVEETQSTQPPKTTMNAKARPTLSSLEGLVQNRPKHHPATYVRFRPRLHQRRHTKHEQSSAKLMKGGTDYVARRLQLGPLTVLPFSNHITSLADPKTVSNKTT
ncbi:zona pellucida sperm-binding protein 3-like [Oreochromis aureus]|uniref:Zona pellucida sperm-binding protein 3 n=1 Tax=Oreochromis aureus TaxID=47969 RepID=A0A668VB32_OREAU|nr:zona pellucida sperm-binding protein 3-like [Oreochromis aureus]